ncbi:MULTISPECIES: cell division protein FtsQ/DivIB [Streptomyces]|uniref:cell division protein FtsQ/DivIB n=1 Tax=unclassified Streptomyces TaxID=2593676 RepID=UPI001F34CA38|nr:MULTISPECIES: FtsQ-type POTRA domain-containing protein [Streptomyces]
MIISVLSAALLAAAAFWLLYGSSWVRVEQVTTAGGRVLTPDELRRAASVPLNAPLVSVDTDAVAARLEERLPRLESAEAEREWPHTIRLNVTERKPELLLEKGGKFIEVDGKGVRYATVDRAPEGVPLLDLDVSDSPSLSRFPAGRLRREAVRVAAGLPAAVHRDTRVVRVRSYDSVTLELTGGRTVVWGSSERADEKARTLLALLKTARNAEHFDVSIPSAPAVSGS